ncbi:tudor domain-containing protein 1-like isoform X2 [Eurosta solidaginis]|uniref:tudor domain-containing protein 1-like isoform X2 n=1 Tax=Eurosta solidaginis TaxID=178769 RepID=UPI00353113F5
MACRTNGERMEIMHSMCKRELEQLQTNLSKYLLDSESIIRNDIFSNFGKESNLHHLRHTNVFTLLAYDRYMSRVAATINLARKFNIHLQLHNLNKILTADVGVDLSPVSYLLEEFVEWHKVLKDNDGCLDHNSEWKSLRSVEEEETSVAISLQDTKDNKTYTADKSTGENYPFVRKISFATPESLTIETWPACVQLLNLSAFVAGYQFAAFITYIDDAAALSFYVCQMRNDMLYELSNMLNLPKSVRMPPPNVVFGISINNKSILRGVLYLQDCNSNDDNLQILLIDYGELVPLDCNDVQFYDLPKVYRELPAQSMKCILLGIKKSAVDDDKETNPRLLRNKLRNYEFKEVNFEVARKTGRVLYVYIVENREAERTKDQAYKRTNASTNPFLNSFDENPTDDNQLQRVKFGSNNNLKFLSSPRVHDVLISDIIYLEILHIAQPNCFYGQILKEKTEQLEQLFWNTEEVALEQKLNQPPELGDLVLAQYAKDEFWYRAKVIGIEDENIYKVFYVDYGNTELVPLKSMVKCNNIQETEPSRAVLCRFAGISDTTDGDEFRFKEAVQMLVVMLLNQRIKVQVVEKMNNDELIVQLLDNEFADTTQMMVNLSYAKAI